MAKAPEKAPLVDKENQWAEEEIYNFVAEKEEPEYTIDNFPLKYTTTDAAILACSRLKHTDKMNSLDMFGFLASFLLHIGTQGIQIVLLWLMFSGPVEGMEDPYESAQFNATSAALKNAIANTNKTLGTYPANTSLDLALATYTHAQCKGNTSPIGVHFIFLILWFAISWDAITTTCHRYVVLWRIPKADESVDTATAVDLASAPKEGNHDITHLGLVWKVFIGIFILLPHTISMLFLCWTGTKMQAFAPTVVVQAKAALKLGVITTISANMMTWFGCHHMHKYMGVDETVKPITVAVNYRILKSTAKPSGLAKITTGRAWMTWGETVVKAIAGLIFCSLVVFWWFDNKRTFNVLCEEYFEKVVGCSAPVGTAGLSATAKKICPTRPVKDWFPGLPEYTA